MITKETLANWLAKNRNMLFLLACVVVGQTLFYYTATNRAKVAAQYTASHLAGRVEAIIAYPRGMPRVRLSSSEKEVIIQTTVAGQKYLHAGDSLVKEVGSEVITTYRRFPTYSEVSVFGPNATDKTGLIRRYQIKKP